MNDQTYQPLTAGTTTTQDPVEPEATPVAGTWVQPDVPQRRGLKDRWRAAPSKARTGAVGIVAFVLLLGVGLGGFALGRGSAPDAGQPASGTTDGRPDFGDGGPPDGGRGGFGGPDQGTDQDTDEDTDSSGTTGTLSWYVVPTTTEESGGSAA